MAEEPQLSQHQTQAGPEWEIGLLRERVSELENLMASIDARLNQRIDHQGVLRTVGSLTAEGEAALEEGMFHGGTWTQGVTNRTISANTNNLTEIDGREIANPVLRIQSDAARNLTGIVPVPQMVSARSQRMLIENGGSFTITLKHNDSGSTAAYRFSLPGSTDVALESGGVVELLYDVSSNVWRMAGVRIVKQIRSIQTGTVSWLSGVGTTQNFALGTSLADYTKAYVETFSDDTSGVATVHHVTSHVAYLSSGTNLRIVGSDATARTFRYTVIELQNLDA